MHLTTYLLLLNAAEDTLADSYRHVAAGHDTAGEADVHYTCRGFAADCANHARALTPILDRYDRQPAGEPERLHAVGLDATRSGPVGLLRDLQDLYQLANLVDSTWTLVGQAAHGARDRKLIDLVAHCDHDTTAQLAWLRMRMNAEAPQALLVAT